MIHELKTWPIYFQDIIRGGKNFELRKNDRGFKVGDHVKLMEYMPAGFGAYANNIVGHYTGAFTIFKITYILTGGLEGLGLKDGYCILALQPIN